MRNSVAECVLAGEPISLTVIFHAFDEGGVIAECLEIPGCVSQGETQEDADANIRDAINGCLSVIFEDSLISLRSHMDLGKVDMKKVSKQESFTVTIPHLQPSFA